MKAEEFNVGDWVVLTKKSSNNWVKQMDKFDDVCVQIITVIDKNIIKFIDDENWTWKFSDGSFRKAEPYEIPGYTPSPDTYSYLTPILKELKIK